MRKDLKSVFWSDVRGVVARFFTALCFVLNDGEDGFGRHLIRVPSSLTFPSRGRQGEATRRESKLGQSRTTSCLSRREKR